MTQKIQPPQAVTKKFDKPEKEMVEKNAAAPAVQNHQVPDLKEERRCNDIFFAIFYLACFAFVIALFAMYGGEALNYTAVAVGLNTTANGSNQPQTQPHHKYKYALQICAGIAGVSIFLSMVWTGIMICMGKALIWIAAIVAIVGVFTAGILGTYFMKKGGDDTFFWAPAALGTLIAIIMTIYICCIRRRIAFASANLQVACKAVLMYPVIFLIAFAMTILAALWCLIWSVSTYAAMNHGEYVLTTIEVTATGNKTSSEGYGVPRQFGIFVGMTLVFFWTIFVIRNIVHVTVSGTVAAWWNTSNSNRKPMTSTTALCRALTLSFGSICFGSFIVSIIETIKTIIMFFRHLAAKSHNGVAVCLLGCLECIIGCISKTCPVL